MAQIKRKKRKRKVRLKEGFKRFLVYSFVIILIAIYATIEGIKVHKIMEYHKTYEYKINQIGYPLEEAKKISSTLKDEDLELILKEAKYNETYYKIINQKYFLLKNYHQYLDYYKENEKIPFEKIIALVNTHASTNWYSEVHETDINQGYLILVNKFYRLKEDYERVDLEPFSLSYAYGSYGENKAAKIVVESFDKMQRDVKEKFNVQIMINSSYRSYKNQESTHKYYGDKIAARPGHSEHQTGLGIDITSIAHPGGTAFGESEEGKWIIENCWRYGFIIRYPKGKEDITGYDNEPWHFRYVGEEVAKQIKDEDITFDEYYAYYIEK